MISEKDQIIKGYDMHIRYLVSYVQAFINYHKNSDFFGVPDLEKARKTWEAANDYNVVIFSKIQNIELEDSE